MAGFGGCVFGVADCPQTASGHAATHRTTRIAFIANLTQRIEDSDQKKNGRIQLASSTNFWRD
jgi:carbohydrate-selective porin OprB